MIEPIRGSRQDVAAVEEFFRRATGCYHAIGRYGEFAAAARRFGEDTQAQLDVQRHYDWYVERALQTVPQFVDTKDAAMAQLLAEQREQARRTENRLAAEFASSVAAAFETEAARLSREAAEAATAVESLVVERGAEKHVGIYDYTEFVVDGKSDSAIQAAHYAACVAQNCADAATAAGEVARAIANYLTVRAAESASQPLEFGGIRSALDNSVQAAKFNWVDCRVASDHYLDRHLIMQIIAESGIKLGN